MSKKIGQKRIKKKNISPTVFEYARHIVIKNKKQQKGIINKTTFNDDDDFKTNTFFNSRFLFKERGSDIHDNLFD